MSQRPSAGIGRGRLIAGVVVAVLVIAGVVAVRGLTRTGSSAGAPAPTPVANRAFPSATDPQAPATVWAVGDGADGQDVSRTVAQLIRRGQPDRILYLGDVYETGTAAEFTKNFAGVYGDLVSKIAPTPGNHEWGNHRTGYDPYWQRVTGQQTPPWYAFTIGGWRVLSLNSETPTNTAQLTFLRSELAKAKGTCVMAFMHRPRFNAGRHGDDPDLARIWTIMLGRARLVLSGHDHNYQRMKPVGGETQLIVGTGGREHYGVNAKDERLAASNQTASGALRLQLSPGLARYAFVSTSGKVLDRGRTDCREG